jgi:hypothetical protein
MYRVNSLAPSVVGSQQPVQEHDATGAWQQACGDHLPERAHERPQQAAVLWKRARRNQDHPSMNPGIRAPLVIELEEVWDIAGHQYALISACQIGHELVWQASQVRPLCVCAV